MAAAVQGLLGKIHALHDVLQTADVPHAFGGALALAWCTQRARGTIDIDINLLLPAEQAAGVLAQLPDDVKITKKDRALLQRDGQVRVWWNKTPLDLFFNSTEFHDELLNRVRWETLAGKKLPFLSCYDLAVFKVFFNRTKDWADLEEMAAAGTLDHERVQATIARYLGLDDERVRALSKLVTVPGA